MITCKALGNLGRFANQLFQIAGIIGIASKSGQQFGFPEWLNADHKERFGSNEDIEIYKHLLNPLPRIDDRYFEHRWINWGYNDLYYPSGNWDLCGHFQSPRYFEHCMELVRYHLTFKDEYEPTDCVAVHYRAGDYIDDVNAYHPRMTVNYYSEAIKHFPEGTRFMLFSDDMEAFGKVWSEVYRVGDTICLPNGKDYIDDFKMMKSCKAFIISNSSYSAMAALLNGGKTVAPGLWFGDVAGINGNDIYHRDWTVIEKEKIK